MYKRQAFQYAVEWGILVKSPVPVDSPKKSTQERTIWTVEEMRAALDSMEDPILHLAVHLTLVGALRAVSYTHLDVYKRQTGSGRRPPKAPPPPGSAGRAMQPCRARGWGCRWGSVSYTHLDVYKRQVDGGCGKEEGYRHPQGLGVYLEIGRAHV